ncbi:MAG: tRNA epoxyqueuosine(34) reductase QueG, partial [Pseudomonadota bacterium]
RKHADMGWMERHSALRRDPEGLLKGCRGIVSLAYPYGSRKPATPDGFTVSRYSRPGKEDYHGDLRTLCRVLAEMIEKEHAGSLTRICVDSAPVLERSFACAAGIGFIGKNNMLINPGYGSFFFLAEILTTAPMVFNPSGPMESLCGSCNLCMKACPTGALERPFSLDASRCLSYLTIESKGKLPRGMGRKMGDCFFGCDRCQEVCPYNGGDLSPEVALPATDEILRMKDADFESGFGRTAFSRAGLEKLKSNIRAVRG